MKETFNQEMNRQKLETEGNIRKLNDDHLREVED